MVDMTNKGQLGEATYQYTNKQDFNTIRENPFTSVENAFQAGAHWMRNIVWHSAKDEKPEPNKSVVILFAGNLFVRDFTEDDVNRIILWDKWAYACDILPESN